VTQGEVLQGELAVAAAEEREESKHVEQEGDHRAGILSGSERTGQPLAAGQGLAKDRVRSKGRRVQGVIVPRGQEPDVP
jgi:hypothetical protein